MKPNQHPTTRAGRKRPKKTDKRKYKKHSKKKLMVWEEEKTMEIPQVTRIILTTPTR